jgi:4-amino-4-deoxy-L-arabinose transferase-like glycosyltransferase
MGRLAEKYLKFLNTNNYALFVVTGLALFFAFYKLGSHTLSPWDESLHGELAYQMLLSGDYLNYQFGGTPEYWFAKPQLAIWSIAGSYSIFGVNNFALRFPSALAIVLLLIFLFRYIASYKTKGFAFHVCLILISINGLIGPHVGRTGDTDALLLLFLFLAHFHFFKYVDLDQKKSALWAGLFLGLAFLTKAAAAFVFVPGWFLCLLFSRKLKAVLSQAQSYLILFIPAVIIGTWAWIITQFSAPYLDNPFGENLLDVMLNYDLKQRFTEGYENAPEASSIFGFFQASDTKFSIWIYVAYLSMLLGGVLTKGAIFKNFWNDKFQRNSFLTWLPLLLFLSISKAGLLWYYAPIWPLLAINTWFFIKESIKKLPAFSGLVVAVILVTFVIKFNYLNEIKDPNKLAQYEEKVRKAESIAFIGSREFDRFLYYHFINENTCFLASPDDLSNADEFDLIIVAKTHPLIPELNKSHHSISDTGKSLIFKKK